jgi:hypothetical protein
VTVAAVPMFMFIMAMAGHGCVAVVRGPLVSFDARRFWWVEARQASKAGSVSLVLKHLQIRNRENKFRH